jgi:hypothetical protein
MESSETRTFFNWHVLAMFSYLIEMVSLLIISSVLFCIKLNKCFFNVVTSLWSNSHSQAPNLSSESLPLLQSVLYVVSRENGMVRIFYTYAVIVHLYMLFGTFTPIYIFLPLSSHHHAHFKQLPLLPILEEANLPSSYHPSYGKCTEYIHVKQITLLI